MYAFIEGTVCEKTNGCLVLQAGGVGWQLNCSNNTLQAAPPLGEKMRCWTWLSVREDAMDSSASPPGRKRRCSSS